MSSKDLNVVSIIGRLTKDSEFRIANNGTPVSNFSIAVNRRRRNGEEWTDEVNFFDVVFMGKGAERINQFLLKGRQIAIVGELHQRQWVTAEGEKRSSVEIWAQEIQLLAQTATSQTAPQPGYTPQYGMQRPSYGASGNSLDNSVPSYQGNYQQRQTTPSSTSTQEGSRNNITSGPEAFDDDDSFPF